MAKKSVKKRKGAAQPSRFKLWAKRIFIGGAVAALVGFLALAGVVMAYMSSLPGYEELKSSPNGQMILVRAADGSELVSLGPSFGEWMTYDEIPQVMKDAIVAVEDRRYESHFGVDPIGLARGLYESMVYGHRVRAVSTITQQLARNIFLTNERTVSRKGEEMLLALALERKFSKEQILELYLNKVYFGGGAYGVDSASRKFFNHPATRLSTAEAAIIAGLVKAPSRYSPTADAGAAIGRASVVLDLMQKEGMISAADARDISVDDVEIAVERGQNSVRYFTDWALPQLDLFLPDDNRPIEVWTTLDPKMQRAATESLQANVPGGAQGALVALDRDGAVRAMVGGTDYVTSNYNRATEAVRQPGSSWKLFVYLAALEAGFHPEDIVVDEPVTIAGWTPRNSGGTYAGDITLRAAFAYSKNTVAAQIGNELGYGTVANMARRFGITTPINTLPSMVLGSSEVRVIDMTRAFAAVGAGGVAIEPYGITKVTTVDGEVLYQHKPDLTQVIVPPYVNAAITDLLQTAVNTGTGRAANIGRPVAGKTGTTNSNKDGWFLGFSSGITTGVWMGRDDAKAVPGLQGGRAPARAFADFMKVAVAGRPAEKFDTDFDYPDWQLEPDDEAYYGSPDDYTFIDEYGRPVNESGNNDGRSGANESGGGSEDIDDPSWLDRVLGRDGNDGDDAADEEARRQQAAQARAEARRASAENPRVLGRGTPARRRRAPPPPPPEEESSPSAERVLDPVY